MKAYLYLPMLLLAGCSVFKPGPDRTECNTGRTPACSNARLYELQKDGNDTFTLIVKEGFFNKKFAIPGQWLVPQEEADEDTNGYVSSFEYQKEARAFSIGKNLVGIHLSSFMTGSGSAMAAAGKDVFLVYDPQQHAIHPGLVSLGITKSRNRAMGCLSAAGFHFLLADQNSDGLVDLGVIDERIECSDDYDETEQTDGVSANYSQQPVQWYVFKDNRWIHEQSYDGNLPSRYSELPLINMAFLPVDFAGHALWNTYDSRKWPGDGAKNLFIPAYRADLITKEAEKNKTGTTY